ncbi:MAG: acylneuraminate cytidylyltransferase [Chloroflexi bacterium HGW-Chloroflexi-3]|nr:MAG: acylneuraminate cytidylyltransferase [Chloroflexi bacterium HGW-Chloroflexi-3]
MQKQKIVAIIQARMTSSRLPEKVLIDIAGFPMLYHVIKRVSSAKLLDQVVVATTNDPADDLIEEFCNSNSQNCFRGHPYDVLDRYYQAALQFEADIIVRITADCPIMDPSLIDSLIQSFLESEVDFAANRLPPPWKRTYPIGLDIEIVRFKALEKAWQEAKSQFEREHVMPYLYDRPGRFKILLSHHEPDYGEKRWTVDTPQDLELINKIFDHFFPRIEFSWLEVIDLFKSNPDLEKINTGINAKNVVDVDNRYITNK